MSVHATAAPRPYGASARPRPPRRRRRSRWLIVTIVLGVLVTGVAVLAASGQLRRSVETTNAVDGEVHRVVVDGVAGDVHVGVADGAPQVTVTEGRPLWARVASTSTVEDGVLRLSSTCISLLSSCSVDHHVELPAGADVQVRATAGEVRLVAVGDVDVELVTGDITVEDATGTSFVTRTETGRTSIGVASQPELVDVSSTTGDVTITVPDAAYLVDAAAELGRVDVAVDQAVDAGLTLRARTVTGGISIQPAAAASVPPPAPAAAQEATQAGPAQLGSPQALEAFLDDVMADHFERFALAGASVTVVNDGQVWVSKGYGHADVAAGTPVDAATTLFPTASVSKLFTWTAIMQLVEQGQLDVDDEVNRYLSGFQIPDNFDEPVRVWHLLSHTAGFEDKPMSLAARPEDLTDLETALIRDMPAQDWEPGRYTAYNNYSTGLAGHLVAEVSGTSWEDYLDRNILQPLDMTHTSTRQPTPENLQPGMTKVYRSNDDGGLSEADYEIVALAPFGGMVATTQDMGNFMLAHLQDGRFGEARILEEATARQMHSQLFSHDPRLAGNAHGFWESVDNGQRVLSHGGDHNTSMTWLALLPDHDLGLYVAYNSDRGGEARRELWEAFLDHGFPTEAPAPAEPAATHADIEQFTGTYGGNRISSTTPGKLSKLFGGLTVSAQGGHLVTDITGYEARRWQPDGVNEFVAVDGHARMIFSDDGARPTHVFFDGPSLTAYTPMGAYAATSWYDRAGLHGGLLAASLLAILSALVLWPVLAIVRRRRKTPSPEGTGLARWWAAATGGLYLLFIVLLVAALLDYYALEYGASPPLMAALIVGVVAAALTVGAVVHTILAWRNGHWSVAGRVHYTLVTLAFIALAWQLNHWNLLGFHV